MPERPVISIKVCPGYYVMASAIRRARSGALAADLMLTSSANPAVEAGTVVYSDRCSISVAKDVDDWCREAAKRAAAEGSPDADDIALVITGGIYFEALKDLKDADEKGATQAEEVVQTFMSATTSNEDLAAGVAAIADLFHNPTGDVFATVPVDGHRETWPLESRSFKRWLSRRFFEAHGCVPRAQSVVDATAVLTGKALFDGPTFSVFTRIAEHEGAIYIDLADDSWRTIRIDGEGRETVVDPPVKFVRRKGMLPLPEPVEGGALGALREFINVGSEDDRCLIEAWLVGSVRPSGPYPVLVVHGEQGSAKSTLSRVLRSLVDPNVAAIRSLPRNERDLVIAANNSWFQVFDNVSQIPDWLSDALCRLSTGGGFSTRTLYENDEESLFNSTRPLILNGIEEIASRGDLLDRSIIVYLPSIPAKKRRHEKAFWQSFERARPALLGALLDAVSVAIRNESTTTLAELPRMADFATWVVAAEPALGWEMGTFMRAYAANRDAANDLALDASVVSEALRIWVPTLEQPWIGSASELLKVLNDRRTEEKKKHDGWPDNAQQLANALRRLAPNLRVAGVSITFLPREGRRRPIRISPIRETSSRSSQSSQADEKARSRQGFSDDDPAGSRDDRDDTHDDGDDTKPESSQENPGSNRAFWPKGDDRDDNDDTSQSPMSNHAQRWRQCIDCKVDLPLNWTSPYCEKHGGSPPGEDEYPCPQCGGFMEPGRKYGCFACATKDAAA